MLQCCDHIAACKMLHQWGRVPLTPSRLCRDIATHPPSCRDTVTMMSGNVGYDITVSLSRHQHAAMADAGPRPPPGLAPKHDRRKRNSYPQLFAQQKNAPTAGLRPTGTGLYKGAAPRVGTNGLTRRGLGVTLR